MSAPNSRASTTEAVTLAFWECGHVEVDDGSTHECDGRDVCSATYHEFVPREQYERDLVRSVMEAERLRSALRIAAGRMADARAMLTPGMKAGVSEAAALLELGRETARKAVPPVHTAEGTDGAS